MTKDYTYGDIKEAKYMDLAIIPVSDVSSQFCNYVIKLIEEIENRKRARRAKDQSSFEYASKLILGDLLIARTKDNAGWLFRSVSKKNFYHSEIKGDTFNLIVSLLEALDYLQVIRGSNHSHPFAQSEDNRYVPGLATRFKASDKLLSLWQDTGYETIDLKDHFKKKPRLNEIQLKSASSRYQKQKIKGKNLRVEKTTQTQAIKLRLFNINKYILKQNFEGMEFYGLRRLYNEGDHPSFNWNLGGRLYGVGENNYQRLKKEQRSMIKINGEAVKELDINASYLRILHSLRDFSIPDAEDIYAIEGIDRRIVKSWISSTLGHTGFHRAWPSRSIEEFEKANIQKPKKLTYPLVMEKVIEHLPVLSNWPRCGVRWSNLMFEESEAMISTMEALREIDVVALPVHDSLIVPHSKAVVAHDILKETFEKRFGVNFVIKGL